MKTKIYLLSSISFVLFFVSCINNKVVNHKQTTTYSNNSYIPYTSLEKSKIYKVFVNKDSLFVAKENCYGNKTFHTTQFSNDDSTEIRIQINKNIEKFKIRPVHLNIKGKVFGNELIFNINKPEKLLIEINNYKPLCIFKTPNEKNIPKSDDPNVIYFSKGIHEAGIITPKDNQIIYLEQGALVKGRIYANNTNNVTIRGRGILDARGFTSKKNKICGIEFKNSNNIQIEGIGLRTGIWWQSLFLLCNDVDISHMNLMSFGENNDGIDIDGVINFKVTNSFIGCGDDGFGWHALDAEKNGQPDTKNCLAENCVIYNAYAGNALRLGASMETNLFENITFKNLTLLEYVNAGIRSDHSDWATFKNVRFKNIYIEKNKRPIEIRIEKTGYSNNTGFKNERGHFENLTFENVYMNGGSIVLEGFDQNHLIKNVTFKNSFNKGRRINNKNELGINEFVKNITFD